MKVFKKVAALCSIWAACWLLSAAAAAQTGNPQQEKLLNGMKVLMWNDPKAGNVSVRIRIHAGSAFDPQGKEGVMQLLSDSLFPDDAAREFFTDDLGGSLSVTTTYDYIEIAASSAPANFLTMLETISTAVSSPQIDKEITAKLKTSLLKRIGELESDPVYMADTAIGSRLFGTFPYGRPQLGSSATVQKIDFANLVDARQRFLTADNATVAVIGNFDRALGFRAIRRYFGNWLKSDRRVPSTFKQPDDPPAGILMIRSPLGKASAIRFAFRGAARNGKDFAASTIFAAALETRLRSRVPEAHAKDVFVRSHPHVLPGSIVIGFSAKPNEAVSQNEKIEANDLVSKAMAEPITESEFLLARKAVQADWAATRDVPSFWLDADTYKISSPQSDIRALESVNISDVRAFAELARVRPMASLLVNAANGSN